MKIKGDLFPFSSTYILFGNHKHFGILGSNIRLRSCQGAFWGSRVGDSFTSSPLLDSPTAMGIVSKASIPDKYNVNISLIFYTRELTERMLPQGSKTENRNLRIESKQDTRCLLLNRSQPFKLILFFLQHFHKPQLLLFLAFLPNCLSELFPFLPSLMQEFF